MFLQIIIKYIDTKYIYIYTSRYSYIHLHGSLDPCRLYQHVLPEYLRSPALTGPCQALLQKLLFLGCGIGDGVSWVSIALSNIRQGEQYSIGLFGQVTVKSGLFLGLAIGGSEPCAVILFFSSYTRYTFLLHEQLYGTYIYLPILLYTRIKIHPASSIAHVDSVCFATSLLVCIAWVLACWHTVQISNVQAGRVHPGDGHAPDSLLKGTYGTIDSTVSIINVIPASMRGLRMHLQRIM